MAIPHGESGKGPKTERSVTSSGVHVVKTSVDSAGRVLVPAKLRKALAIKPGDTVNLRLRGDVLEIRSIDDSVTEAQALVRKYVARKRSLVDELIEDRREEADNES